MNPSFRFGAGGDRSLRVSWGNSERVFRRGRRQGGNGNRSAVLAVHPAAEHPRPHSLNRLRCANAQKASPVAARARSNEINRSSATGLTMPHPIQVPSEIVQKWQGVVDLLAKLCTFLPP